jgi:hypothetical protein
VVPQLWVNKDLTELAEEDWSQKLIDGARTKLQNDEEIDTLLDDSPGLHKPTKIKTLSGPLATSLTEAGDEESPGGTLEEIPETEPLTELPTIRRRPPRKPRCKTLSVPAFKQSGLWEDDSVTQQAIETSLVPTVTTPQPNRRRQVSDFSLLVESSILPTVEEHLEGYVRYNMDGKDFKGE